MGLLYGLGTRVLGLALLLAAGMAAGFPVQGLAQEASPSPQQEAPDSAERPDFAERKRVAQDAIRELVRLSKAPRIYGELRQTLETVIIPAFKETASGTFPGAPDFKPEALKALAATLTYLDHLQRAGAEFETAMEKHGDAMIADASGLVAQHTTPQGLQHLQEAGKLEVTRKAFDAVYALSRLFTGLSLMDARALATFEAWTKQIDTQALALQFPPKTPGSLPDPANVAKAQALVTDVLQILRIDDIVARVVPFLRDVVARSSHLSAEDRKELLGNIQAFELTYVIQKTIAQSLAPTLIASSFTGEQIETLHAFVRAPTFSKLAGLYFDLIHAATAFTRTDIADAERLAEEIDTGAHGRPEAGREAAEAAWKAFGERWSKTLSESISPEVREGLAKSWAELQAKDVPL